MSSPALLYLVSWAHRTWARRAHARFLSAAARPEEVQGAWLKAFLRDNEDTVYGRAHGYSRIGSLAEFQDRVPVVDYDALEPFVRRIARGEARVLTRERVTMFERSSGSTAPTKLVPYTPSLFAEFSEVAAAWMFDLACAYPGLAGTRQYWSLSPAAQGPLHTEGGVPVGVTDDTEYFGPVARWAMRQLMAVPGEVANAPSVEEWRRRTLEYLVADSRLGLVSVWSPTFLTLLMQELARILPDLLRGLPALRARSIEEGLAREGRLTGRALWPKLSVVSAWADASASPALPALQAFFPGTPVQPKGLLATEGVVSFPLAQTAERGSVLAVTGHFLEFEDLECPGARPLFVHELREGGRYAPILTTGGGFARYHLRDEVRCVGHFRQVPLIRFEGKLDGVSDLCGEKLSSPFVQRALERAGASLGVQPAFALLAPDRSPVPRYALFVESEAPEEKLVDLAARVDEELSASHPYRYCRELGQLQAVRVCAVRDGAAKYQAALVNRGFRLGQIKPTCLDSRRSWPEVFGEPPKGGMSA